MRKRRVKWIDRKAKTASIGRRLFFLKGQFEDGTLLGFYSDSPRGCVHDQERGWAVIDSEAGIVLDVCETYDHGPCANDWRIWRTRLKKEHGPLRLFRDEDGTHLWSMARDT